MQKVYKERFKNQIVLIFQIPISVVIIVKYLYPSKAFSFNFFLNFVSKNLKEKCKNDNCVVDFGASPIKIFKNNNLIRI